MDPQVTWEVLLESIADCNYAEAREMAETLLSWLDRGGFPPQTLPRVLSNDQDRTICLFVCRQVLTEWTIKES
ncbi:MAG: hypothetical protein KDA86_16430 [Planctomycetaceae bacterium]|nr:hypothetical protein [Planctomycetaceae bacterium]